MELLVISVLVFLGVLLLGVEIALIPGVGFAGITGVISLIASVAYAFMYMGTLAGWITLVLVVLISVLLFMWAVNGKSLDKVALKKKVTSNVADPFISSLSVGEEGVAVARLALIGEAEFHGNRVEVKSSDGFIDEGVHVVIERISSGVIYVKRV